jgi:nitrogen regulatory protein P-II 2
MGQSMKFVVAIIKPVRLEDVLEALTSLGVQGVTVTEAKDYGQRGQTQIYRALQYTPKFLPMLKIEAAVPSNRVETVTAAIVHAARTGQADDGKIFVLDLEHETHMRIGEVAKAVDKLAPRQAA